MADNFLFDNPPATYANIFSYMNLPLSRELSDDVDAVVLGIPFDMATTARPGSRFGPNAIRQASSQLRWETSRFPWSFTLHEKLKVIDYGDLDFKVGQCDDMTAKLTETAGRIFNADKKLLSFGGDHFVTLPLLRAAHPKHGKMALIHFDAHTDTDDEGEFTYNHGTMFLHAIRENLIEPDNCVQIGIRTEYDYDNHHFEVINGPSANAQSTDAIVQQIKQRVGDMPVYLTFDIDCLDPSFAPGTGTPVVGGLSTDKALNILRGLADLPIVGMDVVEVAPAYDNSEITALAGASIALEMLYMVASRIDK